jgi:hypothetical protein
MGAVAAMVRAAIPALELVPPDMRALLATVLPVTHVELPGLHQLLATCLITTGISLSCRTHSILLPDSKSQFLSIRQLQSQL